MQVMGGLGPEIRIGNPRPCLVGSRYFLGVVVGVGKRSIVKRMRRLFVVAVVVLSGCSLPGELSPEDESYDVGVEHARNDPNVCPTVEAEIQEHGLGFAQFNLNLAFQNSNSAGSSLPPRSHQVAFTLGVLNECGLYE